ncbi:MAG: hypothetical protein ACP5KN_21300, partial [Armatimonadota bacterium]
ALSIGSGWLVSEPITERAAGWLRLGLRVQAVEGSRCESRLLVGVVEADRERPAAQVALTGEVVGKGWRPVSAEVFAPAGSWRLALGTDGGAGRWLVDAIEVEAIEPQPAGAEPMPTVPEDLPADWRPDGLIDAWERRAGRIRELVLNVGGMEVTMPAEVTQPRGHRGGLKLTIANRGDIDKELTVSVAGPPGFFVPERTVTIMGGGTTVFSASLQCFALGEHHARVTFRSRGEEASAPVLVRVTPVYPAVGLAWPSEPPSGEELAAVAGLDAQLHAARLLPGEAPPALPSTATRLLLLGPEWLARSVTEAATHAGAADAMMLYHGRGGTAPPQEVAMAATRELREALEAGPFVLSPPLDLRPGSPPALSEEGLATACELGAAETIAAPSLRLPPIAARATGAVTVGRRGIAEPQPGWVALARSLNVDQVTAAIRAQARLPMFFAEPAAEPTGSEALDAAVLARTLVTLAYQGATGFALPARQRDCPPGGDGFALLAADGALRETLATALGELSRKLAGVVPLGAVRQSEQIGLRDDAAVGFRPFIRGDEGVLALWNNTGAEVNLIFEVRTQPLDMHTLSFTAGGVARSYVSAFHFSDDAIALNRPVVFVSLRPGEVKLLSMQLTSPHAGWLSSVEFKPQIPRQRPRQRRFLDEWDERRINL